MLNRIQRLGDNAEDYCSRCRGLFDHVIVTLADGQPGKVRCQNCQSEHEYRQGKGGRPKKKEDKQALVEKLLEEMAPPRASTAAKTAEGGVKTWHRYPPKR